MLAIASCSCFTWFSAARRITCGGMGGPLSGAGRGGRAGRWERVLRGVLQSVSPPRLALEELGVQVAVLALLLADLLQEAVELLAGHRERLVLLDVPGEGWSMCVGWWGAGKVVDSGGKVCAAREGALALELGHLLLVDALALGELVLEALDSLAGLL